jgi:hypothetical protein
MLGYVTGHLDTNLGNAKSACQLLGQNKDICKNWNPLVNLICNVQISFFPFQWCHQNVIRLEWNTQKKHFSDPCPEIEMNILTWQHIKNWSVHYLPRKDNMTLARYLTPLEWLFWEITCPNPIRQYILVIFLYSCWLIPLLKKVVCFVMFLV